MTGATFPPSGPTTLTRTLNAYVYKQYEDDDDVQAFNAAYNGIAQQYVSYVVGLNLPIYTGLSGPLLDWVATNLYGVPRPSLQYGSVNTVGPLNTYGPNTAGIGLNVSKVTGAVQSYGVNDDIYKRIVTWGFFKGDGFYSSTGWLKRRVMRFLTCANGAATNIDNTYPVSIVFGSGYAATITITVSTANGINAYAATLFQAAVASGVIQLPVNYAWTVVVINSTTGLGDNAGVLQVLNPAGWPTSPTGLAAGALWYSGGQAIVVSGATPNPAAPPVIYGYVTSGALLALGGGNLPTSDPGNAGQLWNNAGVVCVSGG